MKHQYFGDVNDYVKYGLLRALGEVARMRVGVAWMLTPDDDRPDGSRTAYWKDESWRAHDPELFDRLSRLSGRPAARSVELFRRWELVPGALDVDAMLPDYSEPRREWMAAALETLAECPLVFFDPDNGFEVESVPFGRRGSNKYLYWDEAVAAWKAGHSLLVHQHFPREARDDFAERLRERAGRELRDARVTTFRSAHVLFLLAARPEHAGKLTRAAREAAARWAGRIEASATAGPDDRAAVLVAVCDALVRRGPESAAGTLAKRYPFVRIEKRRRTATALESLGVWLDDGFTDRYDGGRLVFPGALHVLAAEMPDAFPYHRNWKVGETHPAWWELYPTIDHVQPVARGGADERANLVTTSQLHNSAKTHWTLEELGWRLQPPGALADWDGLTGWFRAALEKRPELRRHAAVRAWARRLERALADRAAAQHGS